MPRHLLYQDADGYCTARYNCTLDEHLFRLYLAWLVQEEKTEYRISVLNFSRFIGRGQSNMYCKLRKICDALIRTEVYIMADGSDKPPVRNFWLTHFQYHTQKGCFDIEFTPIVRDYFLLQQAIFLLPKQRQDGFEGAKKFKSMYAFRFYEILKPCLLRKQRKFAIEIKTLRWLLNIEETKYTQYSVFKTQVVLQAQSDINEKSDIRFDFEEIKKERKVVQLKFNLKWRTGQKSRSEGRKDQENL